ncbi:TVP38/TMEM64 family protein [Streptococcus pluranimalium]|uniref:TVP38/TMEM64 family protein n=1 Tax=Streptococcus pluranimalium TaxID=82348 RepID=UPI0039FCC07E
MEIKYSERYRLFQKIIRLIGFLCLLATGVLILWLYHIGILNDTNVLKKVIQRHDLLGPLIFIAIQIIQVVFPVIPGGLTTLVGFWVFGWWQGFIYNYVGIIIGSIILFLLVKQFGRKFILLFVKEDIFFKYEQKLESKHFENLFILSMLAPVSPADIMVMVTALTSISLKRFITIIVIAKPFSIIGYSALWMFGGNWLKKFLR